MRNSVSSSSAPAPHGGEPTTYATLSREQESKLEHDHAEMLAAAHAKTWWLLTTPVICGGCGVAACLDPVCLVQERCCCAACSAWTESIDAGYGWCVDMEKVCCVVNHSACPPGGGGRDGVPLLACCGRRWGEDPAEEVLWHAKAGVMKDAWLLYYCLCFGCGVTRCDRPWCLWSQKLLCLHSDAHLLPCISDGVCCHNHTKTCCVMQSCALPCSSSRGVPCCAVCGWQPGVQRRVSAVNA